MINRTVQRPTPGLIDCEGHVPVLIQRFLRRMVYAQVLLPQAVMQLRPRSTSSGSSKSSGTQSSKPSPAPLELDLKGVGSSSETLQAGDSSAGLAQPLAAEQISEQLSAEASQAIQENLAYPPLAKARRLSYCLATALPDRFGEAEGRQVLSFCSLSPWPHFILSRQ